ncbi:hypothetical protein AWH62_03300 [Maricaulis sp. W15]|uniref:ATP-grasp domain-containing protein n=1 Tax=Maricaulis sp. W15 TaxID=1772333 RepID=UPI000948FA7E|nr:hypothetical protein [Maricaulis sp. W15]OLF77712.1 hypothetical protein AWH62_03300 [Maricaulis sp. W15]
MVATASSHHLPFNARFVRSVCARQGWRHVDLDGGAGYLFAVEADGARVLCGSGAVCAYPTNSATAYTIARDKAFTASVLAAAGLAHVPTELWFVETARRHLRPPGRERADLEAGAAARTYPLFAKPNRGAHGDFAERIPDAAGLRDYLARIAPVHDQIVIQPLVEAAEYRVFVVGGQARFQYGKSEGGLTGDGVSNWADLFAALNAQLQADALSPVIDDLFETGLAAIGAAPSDIAGTGQRLPLAGRRNLATGGYPVGFCTKVDPALGALAIAATAALGLDVAGVDIFAPAAGDPLVLEVNANPSFSSLESLGETALAEAIWTDVLGRALAAAR